MTTGQHAAISTMAAMQAAHTAISSNLDNVDTTTEIVGQTGGGTQLLPLLLDLTQGSLRETGRPLGLAAAGFLTVDTGGGSLADTRGGSLRRSDDGTVTDQSGNRVLNIAGGPITGPGRDLGQLAIVDLADGQAWTKVGGNLFLPADPLTPQESYVK